MPPIGSKMTKRPKNPLMAVRPVPNKSYAAPTRGFTSFQFGTFLTSGKLRAGTHGPASNS